MTVTIHPTKLIVRVTIPQNMHVVSLSPGMTQEGDTVVYEGAPTGSLTLQVAFEPSLPLRLWRDVMRPLQKPVFHL